MGNFFFSSPIGALVDTSYLQRRVWKPALKKGGLDYREMKQTRHSFATNALSCGENPHWIARVMGHRDTDMIIRVYGKYSLKRSLPTSTRTLNAKLESAGTIIGSSVDLNSPICRCRGQYLTVSWAMKVPIPIALILR